jgi:hypothetical protein
VKLSGSSVGSTRDLPTKSLARRVADQIVGHVNQPEYLPGRVATVEDFAAIYEREVMVPTFKPSAAKSARSVARNNIIPTIGKYRLDEITGQVPQLMINAMRQRGNSRKTIRNAIAQLSAMLTAARGWGYIAAKFDWDTLFIPVEDAEKEVRCFTPDESQRIIDNSPEPWGLCFALMAYLGLRSGEALALTWAIVDFENRVLRIRQSTWCGRIQTVKSKTSRRDLPLPEALITMLAAYRGRWRSNDHGLLFTNHWGNPISANYVRRTVFHPIRVWELLGAHFMLFATDMPQPCSPRVVRIRKSCKIAWDIPTSKQRCGTLTQSQTTGEMLWSERLKRFCGVLR